MWHPTKNGKLSPELIKPCSDLSVWWKCENKHEWKSTLVKMNTCPRCPKCKFLLPINHLKQLEKLKKKKKSKELWIC